MADIGGGGGGGGGGGRITRKISSLILFHSAVSLLSAEL